MSSHDDHHLRRFRAARTAGDVEQMRLSWAELLVTFVPRLQSMVELEARKRRLSEDEEQEALQRALIRFSNKLVGSFTGVSMGELVNASRQLVRFACADVQREVIQRREREGTSLQEGWDDPDADRPSPAWERDEAVARHDREQRSVDVVNFLDWALPSVLESRRTVLERTMEGAELDEICAELNLKRDNAYQLRSRGFKDLAKLKEQYDA